MTGFLPEDLPDPSDDEAGSLIGSAAGGIPGQVLHKETVKSKHYQLVENSFRIHSKIIHCYRPIYQFP